MLSRTSQEAGESSTVEAGGEMGAKPPLAREHASSRDSKGKKGHKYKSSGGFLLQDAFTREGGERESPHRKKHSRLLSLRSRASLKAGEKSASPARKEDGLDIAREQNVSPGPASPELSSLTPNLDVKKTREPEQEGGKKGPGPSAGEAPLDVESAQIVDMALRISESRRRTSQRPASQPLPPRLAPLPDSAHGSSLRQHLLQQRKISRTGSPRGEKSMFARTASGARTSSGLGGGFDSAYDGGYRYHFSQSTLSRAQKAREHIELLAQYRRLLDFIPPIRTTKANVGSPPSTPVNASGRFSFKSSDTNHQLGRQYNPLQYVRNRKVRARERQAIDGESQGFADVARVTDWVDHVAKSTATTGRQGMDEGQSLLPFAGAECIPEDPASSTSTVGLSVKPKRRRADWFVEPADLIADAYWLEQGHNKQLIEDREWNRVYPQTVESSFRPLSHQKEETLPKVSPRSTARELIDVSEKPPSDVKLAKTETEQSHNSARERAKQKLQDLKGFHHRHNSSVHSHHDFLRLRKGSFSEPSDSDSEIRDRRLRSGTLTTTSKDILEKQMMEMIAREEREREMAGRLEPARQQSTTHRIPEHEKESPSKTTSRFNSRQGSFADASEPDVKAAGKASTRTQSPYRRHRGRPTLDVPLPPMHPSLEIDTSVPNSPEIRAARSSHDLSPGSSRPGTPTRNPFTKVKHIFRERSCERRGSVDERTDDGEPHGDSRKANGEALVSPTDQGVASPDRQRSRSAQRKLHSRGTGESGRGHRLGPSLSLRGEDRPTGIRGIFKTPGARIDNVIRGSVSKIGDIIWRRESIQSTEGAISEGAVTDESESEQRGRRRSSLMVSRRGSGRLPEGAAPRQSKSYLDQMPQFQPHEYAESTGDLDGTHGRPKVSREPSAQSSGLGSLKPARVGVQSASPPDGRGNRQHDSEASDTESRRGSKKMDGVLTADKRLSSMLSMPPSFASNRRTVSQQPSRHWSISDREKSPKHAPISKREVARLRALILSSGIKAMEISRRSNEPRRLSATDKLPASEKARTSDGKGLNWPEIARLSPDPSLLSNRTVAQADMYPLAARSLASAIQTAGQKWQAQANSFMSDTAPPLQRDVDELRTLLAVDLSSQARAAADEADETSRDLAMGQRLKVKRVVDVIEKMGRRRRRRFRWLRRGMWLGVEWVLVGFMWYVWFVVMVFRLFLGVGRGLVGGVRWLLWL